LRLRFAIATVSGKKNTYTSSRRCLFPW